MIDDKTIDERFKSGLAAALKASGLSQKKLADAAYVSRQTINSYLGGRMKPDAYTLAKIASALNVSCDYLLGLSNVPTIDKDIKAAAELTGLSSKAVEALATLNENRSLYYELKEEYNPTADALNVILEDVKERGDVAATYTRQRGHDDEFCKAYSVSAMQANVLGYLLDYINNLHGNITWQYDDEDQGQIIDVMINGKPGRMNIDTCYKAAVQEWIIEELKELGERSNGKYNNEE